MGSCDPLKLGMAGLLLALQLDLRVAARRTNVVRRYFPTLTAMGRVQKEHERTGSFSRMLSWGTSVVGDKSAITLIVGDFERKRLLTSTIRPLRPQLHRRMLLQP